MKKVTYKKLQEVSKADPVLRVISTVLLVLALLIPIINDWWVWRLPDDLEVNFLDVILRGIALSFISLAFAILATVVLLMLHKEYWRCPRCNAYLGNTALLWYFKLKIPNHCHSCGVKLEPSMDEAEPI